MILRTPHLALLAPLLLFSLGAAPGGDCGLSPRAGMELPQTSPENRALYDAGRVAAAASDCSLARTSMKRASDAGYLPATVALGELLEHSGQSNDAKTAIELFKKAAEEGSPRASYDLGLAAADGAFLVTQQQSTGFSHSIDAHASGSERYRAAARYWEDAAKGGDHLAQFELGRLYQSGIGVEKDLDRARELFRAAAPYVPQAKSALADLGS